MKRMAHLIGAVRAHLGKMCVGLLTLIAVAVVVGLALQFQSSRVIEYASARVHTDDVTGLAFASDGQFLISAGADGKVLLWDVRTKEGVDTLWSHGKGVSCLAFDENRHMLGAASYDGLVKVWDL